MSRTKKTTKGERENSFRKKRRSLFKIMFDRSDMVRDDRSDMVRDVRLWLVGKRIGGGLKTGQYDERGEEDRQDVCPTGNKKKARRGRAFWWIRGTTGPLPRGSGGEGFGLGGLLDDAELLHEAESVPVDEAFGDLAVGDASDGDTGDGELLVGCGNSVQITFMSTAAGPAGHNGFAFGDDILDGEVNVGESIAIERGALLFAVRTAAKIGRGSIMVFVVGSKELAGYGKIAVVPEFGEQTADDSFIVFRHEWISFLRNRKTVLARGESGSSVVACNRCGLGCAVVYGGQRVRPRVSGEKGAEDVLPSWRSMRSLTVKETALGLRSGSLAAKARARSDSVLRRCECQEESGWGKKKSEIGNSDLENRRQRAALEGGAYKEKDEEDRRECLSCWAAR
jgi:hypothetical protein